MTTENNEGYAVLYRERRLTRTRVEDALLKLMGFYQANGLWLNADDNRLDGGRAEALEEACAMVETETWVVLAKDHDDA